MVALDLAQDEGPMMITEAEEVTDQLRTQAHSHSIWLSCLWSCCATSSSSLIGLGSECIFAPALPCRETDACCGNVNDISCTLLFRCTLPF